MDSPGPFESLLILAFVLGIGGAIWKARSGRQTLILRQFDVRRQPAQRGTPLVEITGRTAGIVSFVLQMMRMEDRTTLSVNTLEVEYRSVGLFGQKMRFVPLSKVASLTTGVGKPIGYLIVAVFLTLTSIYLSVGIRDVIPLTIALIVSAVLVVLYFINKTVLLEISSDAGLEVSVQFKPGVFEGVAVDVNQSLAAIRVIEDLILSEYRGPDVSEAEPAVYAQVDRGFVQADMVPPSPPPMPVAHATLANSSTHQSDDEEKMAHRLLEASVRLYRNGALNEAVDGLTNLVNLYPSTQAARIAQGNLEKLGHPVPKRMA